jgi:phosphatidylethanolamine/phosphatidyl-N-methylethanolamine N-methyltransferase
MAKRTLATLNDTSVFLQEWLTNPRRTGAIVPSSKNLAVEMARWLLIEANEYVLELGPGTGAVTQALIGRGLHPQWLIAIEKNPKMADILRDRFPRAHIITGDARHLDRLLQEELNGHGTVGAVISSLPLRNFPVDVTEELAGKIRAILSPNGKWVQYTYHLGKERPKGAAYFRLLTSNVVWLNLPPARVSVYQKCG